VADAPGGVGHAVPPSGGGRREGRALRAVAVQFFVNGVIFASVAPRLPEVRDRVGISSAGIGAIISFAGLAGVLSSLVVGRVLARFGTRRAMVAGGVTMAAALALVGVAGAPAVLVFAMAAISLFDVVVDVAMNYQGSHLSRRRASPVMNRLHGLWSLGTVLGGLASSRLAEAGISPGAHFTGAAVLLAAIVVLVGRGLLPTDAPADDGGDAGGGRRAAPIVLALFGVAGFAALAIEQSASEWSSFRLTDDFGARPGVAALGFVAMTAGMTLGRFGGDWATAHLGRRRLTALAVVLAGTGLIMATLVPVRGVSLAGFLLTGIGAATMLPALYDAAAQLPGRTGAGLGALTAGSRLSSLTVPVAIGAMATTSWSVGTALAVATLPAVASFAVAVWLLAARQR
jgi:MFS family permease